MWRKIKFCQGIPIVASFLQGNTTIVSMYYCDWNMVIGADIQILQSVGNSGTTLSFALNIRLNPRRNIHIFLHSQLKQIIGWDLFCDFVTECNDEIISPFARRRNVAWFSKESSRFMSDLGKNALAAIVY